MVAALLVVKDLSTSLTWRVGEVFQCLGCTIKLTSFEQARTCSSQPRPPVILFAIQQPPFAEDLDLLAHLHAVYPGTPVVILAGQSSEDLVIATFNAGARYYLKEPWTVEQLRATLDPLLAPGSADGAGETPPHPLIGHSPAIREVRDYISRVAASTSNVLIVGETGTGKELVAEMIHATSPRHRGPFVSLNSAAIPDTLVESELFGHERGAFTGATGRQIGKLAAANRGTIFLDEIGDISLAVQAKLLRAIETRRVYRLGSSQSVDLDVRILAATNQDLQQAVQEKRFRSDLFYRLNVVRIEVPPLRHRLEDLPLLVQYYVRHFNREFGRRIGGLSPRAIDALHQHHWPGNIRELRNIIEVLFVNLAPETVGLVDVPPQVMRQLTHAVASPPSERDRMLNALVSTRWNKSKAAVQLNWSRMTLYRKMHQYKMASGEGDPPGG